MLQEKASYKKRDQGSTVVSVAQQMGRHQGWIHEICDGQGIEQVHFE